MLRSWLNTDAGRHGAAAADIASALRLCAFLESYPLLVTQLQRASAAGMALGRLAEALVAAPPGALSPSDLGELDLAVNLVRDVDRVGIARAIDGQRIMYGAWLGDRLLKGRALSEIGATAPRLLKWYSWYPARPMLKHEMKAFIRAMADGREFVRAPRSARKKLRDPSSGVGASKPLTKDLLPSFSRIGDRMDVFDTVVEQARAALVLARFRNENRRYPKDWSETGAGEIPDPMGGTLGYHATAASYLITSVGLNGRDEGGEGDDVVWPGRR
jgi:hypothetical protein